MEATRLTHDARDYGPINISLPNFSSLSIRRANSANPSNELKISICNSG